MVFFEERYSVTQTNAAAVNASTHWRIVPSDKTRKEYRFFNKLYLYNKATNCTLRIYFDGDPNNYIDLGPTSIVTVNPEDGLKFFMLDLYNTSGANNIAIGDIIVRYAKALPRITVPQDYD